METSKVIDYLKKKQKGGAISDALFSLTEEEGGGRMGNERYPSRVGGRQNNAWKGNSEDKIHPCRELCGVW